MNTKLHKVILSALVIGLGAVTASAQSTPSVMPDALMKNLGPELQAIVAAHRDAAKALLEQRKATLQALKDATPAQRDAIISNLRELMKAHGAEQKELAKAIRDAIKARRDLRTRG